MTKILKWLPFSVAYIINDEVMANNKIDAVLNEEMSLALDSYNYYNYNYKKKIFMLMKKSLHVWIIDRDKLWMCLANQRTVI